MQLTEQQVTAIRDAAAADPVTAAHIQQGNISAVADYFNEPASPSYIVWRTDVTQDEIMQNGFDWTRVDNLGTGPARVWEWLFKNQSTSINPSKPNVRAGIEAVWKGTQADLNVRAAVYTHCKREATRAEKLFATGSGTDAVPSTLGVGLGSTPVEGDVSFIIFAGL